MALTQHHDPESILMTGTDHRIYVSTDAREVGSFLDQLGFSKDNGVYRLGTGKPLAIRDIDSGEAQEARAHMLRATYNSRGFIPQCRINAGCSGNPDGYVGAVMRLLGEFDRNRLWYSVFAFQKHVYVKSPRIRKYEFTL